MPLLEKSAKAGESLEVFRYISVYAGLHMTSSKHDDANHDQFAQNLDMAYKTIQCVSVPNLKLFGPMKTKLWAKEI